MTHKPTAREDVPVYLTEDRLAIRDLAREFTAREVLPVANRLDPEKGDIPDELRQKMADMGFFGIMIDEEHGGLGLGVFEYCLVAEELARGWLSVSGLLARGNGMGGGFTAEQEARLLPRVARGEWLGAYSLSEAEAGSDVANISCRAVRDGDAWVINGTKMWCTYADQADYLVLFARTDPDRDPDKPHRGISTFLVEKERGSFPAGITGTPVRKIGYFGWQTWELSFDDFRIPADALLGEEGRGFYMAVSGLEVGRAHTAARAIGLARAALEDSIAYVATREQFGRPIGEFQYLRFEIAKMAADIEAARQLMYSVATAIDSGRRCSLEAAMCKLVATEMAERVTSQGVQIHGGAGYTTDFQVERHWRDARLTRIFEGTSEIQMRIISDELLGR
ncbi:butyryl-CoA dehydrogenase [Dietzia kunjamensis subsp. schimae]|uniref:Butyryl-CoA dehydrogenase n=1 Tax=Dietzia kunjamensis subsp. schimae TaxID=498198 RepID=A0ABY1MXH1_9ACTN|nr:acyl-CoA dehydrogenase family protein [Dietzia kunjamensis]MBB1016232.1 acyl-CoA dehydrogenase [Dietzia kunjamensis subsp. schimae]SMO40927.1 butyryl-CoA dehydrogenase [Dietzia kunjamensis subsp. schimae]